MYVDRAHLCVASAATVGAAALLLTACGAPAHVAAPVPSASIPVPAATATPSSASAVASTAALAAYDGMWSDEQTAARTADYQSPLLEQHASGAALSLLVRGLYSYQLEHFEVKGHLVTHSHVTSLQPAADPTRAGIVDCGDDTHWLLYKDSGGLQNNVPGGHRRITAVVQDIRGVWKVTTFDTGAEGTC